MKKRISKFLIIVLILLLSVIFAACNNGGGNSSGGGKDEDPETASYTIAFNSNGGTIYESQTVKYGALIKKPVNNPVKTGYTFTFWSANNSSEEYDFATPVTKKFTLTAQYANNVYKHKVNLYEEKDKDIYTGLVSFKSGDNDITELSSEYDKKSEFGLPETTKDGDYFVYWYYLTKDADNKPVEVQFTTWATTPEAEKTKTVTSLYSYKNTSVPAPELYAKWHSGLKDINIAFDANGDNVSNLPAATSVKFMDTVSQEFDAPTRIGYDFIGWYYETVQKIDGKEVTVNKDFVFDGEDVTDATVLEKDIVLFAKWQKHIDITSVSDFMGLYGGDEKVKNEIASANIYLKSNLNFDGKVIAPIFSSDMPFTGTFNGGGYTLSNVVLKGDKDVSMFGVSNGIIKDIKMGGVKFMTERKTTNTNMGVFTSFNYGKILDCSVNGITFDSELSGAGKSIIFGGITANNNTGEISGCALNLETNQSLTLTLEQITFGGIVGKNTGNVTECTVSNLIFMVTSVDDKDGNNGIAFATVGGICGNNNDSGKINKCFVDNVTLNGESTNEVFVGGAVGMAGTISEISETYGTCYVSAQGKVALAGGIAGRNNATIKNCYVEKGSVFAKSNVSGGTASVGGIAGDAKSQGARNISIVQCYVGENVSIDAVAENSAAVYAGGIVGTYYYLTLRGCFSMANVSATNSSSAATVKIGLIAGLDEEKNSTVKDNLFYWEKAILTLNGEEYKVEEDTENFAATVKGKPASEENFMSDDWLKGNVSFVTDSDAETKNPVWHVNSDEGLPSLVWAEKK